MYQMRQRQNEVFDQEATYLSRPASAQGRFASPGSSRYGPPGFDASQSLQLDPAMAQALATLTAAGNLTPQQIQQIQMQLRFGSPTPQSNATGSNDVNKMQGKMGGYQQQSRTTSPNRRGDKRDHSPTSNNGGTSPTRSPLLEEFRANKNKKYDLSVSLFFRDMC